MTDQEKFNAELQMKTNLQEAKFNMLVNELKEQRQDIRDLNKRIDDKFDKLSEQMHNMLIGVGGMMVALGAFLVAVLK